MIDEREQMIEHGNSGRPPTEVLVVARRRAHVKGHERACQTRGNRQGQNGPPPDLQGADVAEQLAEEAQIRDLDSDEGPKREDEDDPSD